MTATTPKTKGYVYFAALPDDIDCVKIGFTKDIASRMTTLSTGSPQKLEVQQFFSGCLRWVSPRFLLAGSTKRRTAWSANLIQ